MKRVYKIVSIISSLAAILALACIIAHPAFGQGRNIPGGTSLPRDAQTPPEEQWIKVFKLAHSDAETMAHILTQTIQPGLSAAIDQRNNAIVVVTSSKENMQKAEGLISSLDSADLTERGRSSPVNVRLVWLVEGDESAAAPAENLKGVIEELHRQGLKNLGQVGANRGQEPI